VKTDRDGTLEWKADLGPRVEVTIERVEGGR